MPLHPRHAPACLVAGLLGLAMATPRDAHAADLCVTTTAELQAALDTADDNGEDDVIRLAQGTYPAPTSLGLFYRGGATFGGDDNHLTIIGGFVADNGDPCGTLPPDARALDTLLDGEDREPLLQIYAGEGSHVSIRGLGFVSGKRPDTTGSRGAGLYMDSFGHTGGTFTVERCLFVGNEADFGAAVAASNAREVRFVGNLVAGNNTSSGSAAVELVQNDQTGIYAINNTIVDNTTDATPTFATATGLYVSVGGTSNAFIANNILWGNEHRDIRHIGTGFITLRNNSIQVSSGTADSSEHNVAIAPAFDGGAFGYGLLPGSALVDIGVTPGLFPPFPPAFETNWTLPARDVDGGPRVVNATVDLGADEAIHVGVFGDGFESG